MESPALPIIVKVDGLTEEFSAEGRKKLRTQYIDTARTANRFIPAEALTTSVAADA